MLESNLQSRDSPHKNISRNSILVCSVYTYRVSPFLSGQWPLSTETAISNMAIFATTLSVFLSLIKGHLSNVATFSCNSVGLLERDYSNCISETVRWCKTSG